MSNTIVQPPILRSPTEIRLEIYRHLLLSEVPLRMQLFYEKGSTRIPNCLYPAILRTCHHIYSEAMNILYGENIFRAHSVDDSNSNPSLITRAHFIIGTCVFKDREIEASGLTKFLDTHPSLKFLALRFKWYLLENTKIRDISANALRKPGYASALSIFSDSESTSIAFNTAQLL